jgi:hypothetical protein
LKNKDGGVKNTAAERQSLNYAKLSFPMRPLHKSAISQFCHPEPSSFDKLRMLRTGSAKDHGIFLRPLNRLINRDSSVRGEIRRSFRMTACAAFVDYAKVSFSIEDEMGSGDSKREEGGVSIYGNTKQNRLAVCLSIAGRARE